MERDSDRRAQLRTTDERFPLGSIYGRGDTAEVRRAFYEARKKQGKVSRRRIISFMEWRNLEKSGADMSKYITVEAMIKQERKEQMNKIRAARQSENQRD